jgi:alkanesulfonate monooxygenase SsuD/methylene tetrahydromethanopterin reductase-like flavin-dependent oxidoreductase (luciferase family)
LKFGILFTSQPNLDTDPYPYRSVHERVTAEICRADQLGFDYAWIAEHHASRKYGILPDPMIYIAYLASRTERIRFGTAVMTLPLQNILRLAENSAFVDILTGGRLVLGVGSGYRTYEFDAFDVDFEARREIQEEALPLLIGMLRTHQVEHVGKYFRYRVTGENEIFPRSVQEPYPPLYMAAASEQSIGVGARSGLGLLLSTLTPVAALASQTAFYRTEMEKCSPELAVNPAFGDIDVARFVYVAETDEEAREESSEGILRHIASFSGPQTHGYLGTVFQKEREFNESSSYDSLNEGTIIHGSPDSVTTKIERLVEETGASSLMLHFPPYYGTEKVSRALGLFASEVMPRFSQKSPNANR